MGHVEIPDTDISAHIGLAGAPRPRTATSRNRNAALEQLWQTPTAERAHTERPRARKRAGRHLPLLALADALGLGGPAWLVLAAGGRPAPLITAALSALAWTVVRSARGRYTQRMPDSTGGAPGATVDWLLLLGVLAVLLTVSGRPVDPAIAVMALVPGLALTLLVSVLRQWTAYARRRLAVRRVLVVGHAAGVDRAVNLLNSRKDHSYTVAAAIPVGTTPLSCEAPVPGRLAATPAEDDLSTVLGGAFAHDADLVLVAPGPELADERLRRLSWGLHDSGVPLCVLSEVSETAASRVRLSSVAGLTLLHIAPPLRSGPQPVLKTLVDRAGAAFGLVSLAPLLLVIAMAVRLTSPGPVFHRQTRHGQHSRPFTMWKFRTMVEDAEVRKAQLGAANEAEGPMFKMRSDPRVTRVGRTLRRASLDELPQLINVLRGEMSLVGPRPPLPEEVSRYDEREHRRLAVKPGLTGLWQVSGRSDLSWQETVSLDLWYVDNWTVATDIGLLARTVRAVTDGRGAY